jgi:putative SOS response-associated peptidase YedK
MCGRYTLRNPRRFKFDGSRNLDLPLEARYNIAPSQSVLVVADFGSGLEASYLVWGLIPSWSREQKGFINARSETLEDKPSFSEPFQRRRCLIPADGFFEWKRLGRAKQPFYFQLKDESPFAFAGVWDKWQRDGDSITSCAIITTTSNELLATIHDRMPVILTPKSYDAWLHPEAMPADLKHLLSPFPASGMTCHPVSSAVNYPENEGEQLIQQVDTEPGTNLTLW